MLIIRTHFNFQWREDEEEGELCCTTIWAKTGASPLPSSSASHKINCLPILRNNSKIAGRFSTSSGTLEVKIFFKPPISSDPMSTVASTWLCDHSPTLNVINLIAAQKRMKWTWHVLKGQEPSNCWRPKEARC